ncbi:MAG TPA: sulfotransferase domain-containing protein [Verrucomicrobiae bacterium]|nr:sulfotransferase domain-containing protein [Verrucomicrobiae bacterium]
MPILRKLRHQVAKTGVRAPLVWVRHKSLRADDVFFASYPRSGSTWLRFVLFESIAGQASGFGNVNESIPDVKEHKTGLPLMPNGGRLIKTHEVYHPEYKRAVYLVRDPRDVALSEYAYQTALGLVNMPLDEYLRVFLTKGVNPFASWSEHVQSWISSPLSQENLLIVKFEDLRRDTVQGVSAIVRFFGLTPDEEHIRAAVANNSVERMKAKEKETPQRASKKGQFIRSGSVGGWRKQLTEGQVKIVRNHASALLTRLQYPLEAEMQEPALAAQ